MSPINTKQYIITAAVALVVGMLAFAGGMQFQKSRQPAWPTMMGRLGDGPNQGVGFGNGQDRKTSSTMAGNRQGFMGRPVAGEITAVNKDTMTVKMNDGSSKIVVLSTKAAINRTTTASASDLVVGQTVVVFGQSNEDGSVTAQNIQLNPMQQGSGEIPAATNPNK